jgi:release factor glutamine methyltransferase
MTYHEALSQGTAYLKQHGIADAQSSARFLLADLFNGTIGDLDSIQIKAFSTYLERRASHEPVAYILGYQPFAGLNFTVDRNVLIPRPETERLVELVVNYAKTHAVKSIVEVGTGSGAIAISLAKQLPATKITATDISPSALALAKHNKKTLNNYENLRFVEANLLQNLSPADVIVANLPYIPSERIDRLASDVKDFEPRLALDGGPDGLDLYRQLADQINALKTKPRAIFCEIDETHGGSFMDLWTDSSVVIEKDLAGLNRYAVIWFTS